VEIELADAVASARDELVAAAKRGVGQQVAFTAGPIELVFAVELRQDAKAQAGFRAWVVSGDVAAGAGQSRTHRMKITLTPQLPGGADLRISGDPDRPVDPGDVSGHISR
jgi:hypothetical protein